MTKPTLQEFKKFCRQHRGLAIAVCEAMALAQVERERVNAYILPMFKTWDFRNESGEPITSPDSLYRCHDEASCALYYDHCDDLHRAHGFTGPRGHCPALVAEHLQIIAERALLDAGCKLMGLEDIYHTEKRKKMLDLLIGACLKTERKAA